MNDELLEAIRQYLKEHLRVEVLEPNSRWSHMEYPIQPTVKVRLMLEGEVVSEDEVTLVHSH